MESETNKPAILLCLDTIKGIAVLESAIQYLGSWQLVICVTHSFADSQSSADRIRKIAEHHNCLVTTNRESNACSVAFCQEHRIRRILCVGWKHLIGEETLNLLKGHVLVAHDSLLPRLRGFAPLATAILTGESQTGVSLIHAGPDVDAGNLIWQETISISQTDTSQTLTERLLPLYEKCLTLALKTEIATGTPQNHNDATYSIWRDEADYRVCWQSSASEIDSAIRAFSFPYGGAQTLLNGELTVIHTVEIIPDLQFAIRQPGKIWSLDGDGCPVVVCGSGMVKITALTRDGKQRSPYQTIETEIRMISHDFPLEPDCDVSVVIPVYRSAEFLKQSVSSICDVMNAREESYEIILVEDGSPDDSWLIAHALHEDQPHRITAVQLTRNFGQHNAIMCGFRHARGAIIVTIDDDLQNPASQIPTLLDAIQPTDVDLVYGVPRHKQHALGRNLGSALVNRFFQLVFGTGIRVTSFRAIKRPLIRNILTYTLNFTYIDGLLAWNTQRIQAVTVQHVARQSGESGYSLRKLTVLAINLFTNFSVLPLQIASAIGLTFSAAGLGSGAYYLIRALTTGISVPGYASIIVAVMVLGGIQLLAIGVIGEYVGRLHLNVNRKPQYSTRQRLLRSHQDSRNASEVSADVL